MSEMTHIKSIYIVVNYQLDDFKMMKIKVLANLPAL